MKVFNKIWLVCFGLLFVYNFSFGNPPTGDGGGGGEDPDNDVPIDGGISLLIAAGAGYGISRFIKKKKK